MSDPRLTEVTEGKMVWSRCIYRTLTPHQHQRDPQMAAALSRSTTSGLAVFCSTESYIQTSRGRAGDYRAFAGEQSITVKRPISDPEGCARFVCGLTQ